MKISRLRHLNYQFSNFPYCHSLVGRQVHARWSFVILRIPQRFRPHRYVLLLHARRNRTTNATVSLVEEVLDSSPNGSVRRRDGPRIPTSLLQSMQLPDCIRLVDRNARLHVLLLIQKLLQ